VVLGVFILAITLWTTATYTKLDATNIAMIAVCIMLWANVLNWKDVTEESGAWVTMIWMGSLISLATYLSKFGLIDWFAKLVAASIAGIPWLPALMLLLAAYMYSHYGFASLAAHVTAMYAAFIAVAVAAGAPAYLAALSTAFVANLCAGLTHYATGPAPIYFGAGFVPQGTWWKLGFILSIVNVIVWVGLGALWWKVLGLW